MAVDTQGIQAQATIDAQVEQFYALFAQFRQVLGADFKHAHQHGMSTTQFIVLGLVEKAQDKEPCTISWLASKMNIDPATVVRTVDSLEKRGLVERRRDRQDRRQVFVEFTEAGRAARKELHQRFKTRIAAIFSEMSEEGRTSLLMGLQEFVLVGLQESREMSSGERNVGDAC